MNKKGGISLILIILVIVLVIGLGIGSYFLFFGEKCATEEIFNPYQKICVNKDVLCNLDKDCLLLEGQTASFPGESLTFDLISAREGERGQDSATININGAGEVNLGRGQGLPSFDFGEYTIYFESSDGDANKIMGASFEVIKTSEIICVEDWNCEDWTSCLSGQQTRTCTDSNSCDTIMDKPIEEQTCEDQNTLIQVIKEEHYGYGDSDTPEYEVFSDGECFKISPYINSLKVKEFEILGFNITLEGIEAYEEGHETSLCLRDDVNTCFDAKGWIVISFNGVNVEIAREQIKSIKFGIAPGNRLLLYFVASDIEGESSSVGSNVCISGGEILPFIS